MAKTYKIYRYWIEIDGFEWSYVGCTCRSLDKRAGSKTGLGYIRQCPKFGFAIETYGWGNFQREILEDGLTEEEAFEREQYYIQKFDSINHGFNTSSGGKGAIGVHPSEESRKKMSESNINHPGLSKVVLQYDRQGNFLAEYPSTHEAERQTGVPQSNIVKCCKGRLKSAGTFFWKYKAD